MIRYLLDTNIASLFIRNGNAAVKFRMQIASPSELAVSAVTEAEMRFGLARLPPEAKIHRAVNEFLVEVAILPWDTVCAKAYAKLAASQQRSGKNLSALDTMIAAHALALDLTIVTNDHAFQQIPELRIEDWTKGPQPA